MVEHMRIALFFDATVPAEARRICWRGDGPDPCPCRALEPGEVAYETRVR